MISFPYEWHEFITVFYRPIRLQWGIVPCGQPEALLLFGSIYSREWHVLHLWKRDFLVTWKARGFFTFIYTLKKRMVCVKMNVFTYQRNFSDLCKNVITFLHNQLFLWISGPKSIGKLWCFLEFCSYSRNTWINFLLKSTQIRTTDPLITSPLSYPLGYQGLHIE